MRWLRLFLFSLFTGLGLSATLFAEIPSSPPVTSVPLLRIDGAIGPAIGDYLIRNIEAQNQAPQPPPAIMISMDTPGGLVASLRDINQSILTSDIPVLCLVHPQGARAASAGTFILYACHVAAMSPATTLGAATPVQMGSPTSTPKKEDNDDKQPASAMEKKILNDSIAYIRSLAQLRGRNEDWAEQAVREAATLTADEALKQKVINLIADDPADFLMQLDGQQLVIEYDGETEISHQFNLAGVTITPVQPDWRNQFIQAISDPNIAYILMLVGIYGLLLEFYSPGIGIAGVTGAISLLLAMYALQMLPINFIGIALLLLGIGLLITESLIPSFGIFGFGGLVAFVIGSIFLVDSDLQEFRIAVPLIAAVTICTALFILLMLGTLLKARHRKTVSGREAMIGAQAVSLSSFPGHGQVLFGGENWQAESQQWISQGEQVRIDAIDGLTLQVSAIQAPNSTQETQS